MRVCIVLHADLFEPWPIVRPMNEARLLRGLGRDVVVFSWIKDPDSPLPEEETRDGLRIRRHKVGPPMGVFARALGLRRLAETFADEIAALRPDAILCHDLEMLWASVIAGRRLGVPVLYHAHEDWPAMVSERSALEAWAFERLERRLLKRVEHVYAAGEDRAERFRGWGKAVTVVYGSKARSQIPEVSDREKREIRARYGFGPHDVLVGIAGSLGRDEALGSVLDALRELPPNVKLFIVGGGRVKLASARELVARRGLSDRVAFTGELPTDDYLRQVSVLDIGLTLYYPTTRNQTTVVPLKLFDYMALGIPVIASDFSELRRIVVERCGCGHCVPPTDTQAVRDAIARLAARPDERLALGAHGTACFDRHYSGEVQAAAIRSSHAIFHEG